MFGMQEVEEDSGEEEAAAVEDKLSKAMNFLGNG